VHSNSVYFKFISMQMRIKI